MPIVSLITLILAFQVTRITPGLHLLWQKTHFEPWWLFILSWYKHIRYKAKPVILIWATAVMLLLKQPTFTLHLLCITKRCQTNAVSTRVRRYEITEKGDTRGEFETLLCTCFGGDCCVWAASVGFCLRPKLTILADKPLVGRSVCLCPLSRGHWEEQQSKGEKGL